MVGRPWSPAPTPGGAAGSLWAPMGGPRAPGPLGVPGGRGRSSLGRKREGVTETGAGVWGAGASGAALPSAWGGRGGGPGPAGLRGWSPGSTGFRFQTLPRFRRREEPPGLHREGIVRKGGSGCVSAQTAGARARVSQALEGSEVGCGGRPAVTTPVFSVLPQEQAHISPLESC